MTRPIRRPAAVLAFTVTLILPWSARAEPLQSSGQGRVDVWEAVARVWGGLVSFWEEEGCGIDPSGRCAPNSGSGNGLVTPESGGCGTDSSGACTVDATGQADQSRDSDSAGAQPAKRFRARADSAPLVRR
jgi:hypothetical protein